MLFYRREIGLGSALLEQDRGRKPMFSSLTHTKGQGGLSAMSTGGHRPKDINSRIKIVEYNTREDNTMPETITIC